MIRIPIQLVCQQHSGEKIYLFCKKCIRLLCTKCHKQRPLCKDQPAEAHDFLEIAEVSEFLRKELDSIQSKVSAERECLLDEAKSTANKMDCSEEELNGQVEQIVQREAQALKVIQQLQMAIRAAAASAIASVLRVGVKSNATNKKVDDVQTRALACRQQNRIIDLLQQLDEKALLERVSFMRNQVIGHGPISTPNAPAPPTEPGLDADIRASTPDRIAMVSDIESQMQNITNQGKELIQELEIKFKVCLN